MKSKIFIVTILFAVSNTLFSQDNFHAPAYPLVTHDPYFSIWSLNEDPTIAETTHWTLKPMPIHCMVRLDGKIYRLMGDRPGFAAPAKLTKSEVMPTTTTFTFSIEQVEINMSFLSPVIAEDLDLVSRPLTYVTWSFVVKDNKKHSAEIYFDISGLATVDQKRQQVVSDQKDLGNLKVLRMGSKEQPVLEKNGDDLRIDWGYLYVVAPASDVQSWFMGRGESATNAFADGKNFPEPIESDQGRNYDQIKPVLAYQIPVSVDANSPVEKHIMLAYDDIYSVIYFNEKLGGYWKKKFSGIDELLQVAEKEYSILRNRCTQYDKDLYSKAMSLGGREYADICALAYRQCMAAHKVVKDKNGQPLCFSKENFSNGSMGTVDVFYPASPFFLYLNPELMKAQTTPIFDYAESGK